MKDRMMVPVGTEHHEKLKEMAKFYHRSITNETEWLIETAYREHEEMLESGPNVPYPTLLKPKPGVQQEE